MGIPEAIIDLVRRFEQNKEAYSAPAYNETQLRREFLDPFFEALGWDISNRQGYAEAYKEVIHEDAIKIGTKTKAPDYSFRIGGTRKFFLEAKKPSINIKDDISPAFQLRRYAWSGKLPLSILSDFEEFAVYDCRIKPNQTDKASVGRILYIRYDEYEKRWDEIAANFSKDSVLNGSFDKYAESAKGKKGTSEVDNEFLGEIERWRDLLARNISIRNPKISQHELNFAVQRTIDRIIFLRICEDRGIEQYGSLMMLLNGENVYPRMQHNFQRADEIYNSGLFHFRDEKGRSEPPDTLTLSLQIDDKPLKDIIANLYYPESPYEFSVLPADILGQVYEQFLGKVIRLTDGHQAKVEDKPEVKKAGGVFYTPTYIVDYIVKNTVRKLIENKIPKQIEKLKILDPACGSGSFLIQAYQALLDYHRDWYINDGIDKNSKGKEPKLTKVLSGEWRLSTSERKKILLNNIHGVDIDSQAVEVTKLSLLLKVLEGENEQSLKHQMTLWHERALPDLENNIKCGNSLIGTNYYEANQTELNLFDNEEQYRINAFDWDGKDGFPEIMKNDGFDAVIGNPPYVAVAFNDNEKEYFNNQYKTAQYQLDLYIFFIEKGVLLLKQNGYIGLITPNSWLKNLSMSNCRLFLLENLRINKIVPKLINVFKTAAVDTLIFTAFKNKNPHWIIIEELRKTEFIEKHKIEQITFNKNDKYIFTVELKNEIRNLIEKIKIKTIALGNLFEITRGVNPYDVYTGQSKEVIETKAYHADHKKDVSFVPELRGKHVKRYCYKWDKKNYISYGPWLAAPRDIKYFKGDRIVFREILGKNFECTYIHEDFIIDRSLYIARLREESKSSINIKYVLALLSSKLLAFYFRYVSNEFDSLFPKIRLAEFKTLPINAIDKSEQSNLVEKVDQMLDLHKKLPLAKTDQEKTIIQRQIDSTDCRIDELVYELYGLTEDEIKIVEGANEGK